MANSRLSTIAPDLEDLLRSVPEGFQVYAGWQAARWAVGRVGLEHPVIVAALGASYSEKVPALAAELDDRYFALLEWSEGASCTAAELQTAFSHARAASAIVFAAEGEAADAVYESAIATDAIAELRAVVRAAVFAD